MRQVSVGGKAHHKGCDLAACSCTKMVQMQPPNSPFGLMIYVDSPLVRDPSFPTSSAQHLHKSDIDSSKTSKEALKPISNMQQGREGEIPGRHKQTQAAEVNGSENTPVVSEAWKDMWWWLHQP